MSLDVGARCALDDDDMEVCGSSPVLTMGGCSNVEIAGCYLASRSHYGSITFLPFCADS